MRRIERSARRVVKPQIFLSHSSRDRAAAVKLARILNCCSVDVWLDDWELEVGASLSDEISKAMEDSRFIAILITKNYNKTVWTKTEYKKACEREEKENRTVMLPLVVGKASIPRFIAKKVYVDLRRAYFSGITRIVGMVHNLDQSRLSQAMQPYPPKHINGVWGLLMGIGFDPYVVLGKADFEEMLQHGGRLVEDGYAEFYPDRLIDGPAVSEHVKRLARELL